MLKDICIHDTEILLSKKCITQQFLFISITLISDNYSSTFLSLWTTFYRQISLMMKLYPPIIVTRLTFSASFSYTDNSFYSSSSLDATTVFKHGILDTCSTSYSLVASYLLQNIWSETWVTGCQQNSVSAALFIRYMIISNLFAHIRRLQDQLCRLWRQYVRYMIND